MRRKKKKKKGAKVFVHRIVISATDTDCEEP